MASRSLRSFWGIIWNKLDLDECPRPENFTWADDIDSYVLCQLENYLSHDGDKVNVRYPINGGNISEWESIGFHGFHTEFIVPLRMRVAQQFSRYFDYLDDYQKEHLRLFLTENTTKTTERYVDLIREMSND